MAVDFSETFEGGTNGTAITSGNTQFNGGPVGAGAVTFDNSTAAHGSLSAKLVSSANSVQLQRTFTSSNQRTVRRYYRLGSYPASTLFFILGTLKLGAGAATATMRVTSGGQIQIRDGLTTVATSGSVVSLNSWFRLEWQVDGVGLTQSISIFLSPNTDGSVADEVITGTYSGGNFDTGNTGQGSSSTATIWMDDALDDSALVTIGPGGVAPSATFTFQHTVTIGS